MHSRRKVEPRQSTANVQPPTDPRVPQIAEHVRAIMQLLQLDLADPNLTETPELIAGVYLELFSSVQHDFTPTLSSFPNTDGYSQMVSVVGVSFYSMCAHHFLPFFGKAHVAYVPGERIAGLGELARVVDLYARRPQLQEQLSQMVVDCLSHELRPAGAMVVLQARHLCMEMRGPHKPAGVATTTATGGVFEDRALREEFLRLAVLGLP